MSICCIGIGLSELPFEPNTLDATDPRSADGAEAGMRRLIDLRVVSLSLCLLNMISKA